MNLTLTLKANSRSTQAHHEPSVKREKRHAEGLFQEVRVLEL